MKRIYGLLVIGFVLFSLSSCYVNGHRHGHTPPGQAKKKYAGKSAKRYAPGQQKKKGKSSKGHKPYKRHDVMWPGF